MQLHFPELGLLESHPDHPAVVSAAKAWGKAVMLCCWMGHLTPRRPEWFANLCHPDHWPASCPNGGCKVVGCRGNGFLRSADGREYILLVPNHKTSDNSSVRDRAPITYPMPPSMFIWCDVWFRWCWPLLAAQVRAPAWRQRGAERRECILLTSCCCVLQGTTTAFCTFHQAVPLQSSSVTTMFKVGVAAGGRLAGASLARRGGIYWCCQSQLAIPSSLLVILAV